MEFPDQLKKPAPTGPSGFDALDDFLWEAASWDPEAEQVLLEFRLDGPEPELVEVAQRLLTSGRGPTARTTRCGPAARPLAGK